MFEENKVKAIEFYKVTGAGNDFIVIDNRKKKIHDKNLPEFVRKVCERRISVGADGVLLIEESKKADFMMRIVNPDGSEVEMCGNGARCVAKVAYETGIASSQMSFKTKAGIIEAWIVTDGVRLKMSDPVDLVLDYELLVDGRLLSVSSINTGVPHVVLFFPDLEKVDVISIGRALRYHERYSPAGTNVNFVKLYKDGYIDVRTYERGVEDETLACGTGITASAIVTGILKNLKPPVEVYARSGDQLFVDFKLIGKSSVRDVFLTGPARIVYQGKLV